MKKMCSRNINVWISHATWLMCVWLYWVYFAHVSTLDAASCLCVLRNFKLSICIMDPKFKLFEFFIHMVLTWTLMMDMLSIMVLHKHSGTCIIRDICCKGKMWQLSFASKTEVGIHSIRTFVHSMHYPTIICWLGLRTRFVKWFTDS